VKIYKDKSGAQETFTYDENETLLNRVKIFANGDMIIYEYNENEILIKCSDIRGDWKYIAEYDEDGNIVKEFFSDNGMGGQTIKEYDEERYLVETSTTKNGMTISKLDPSGNVMWQKIHENGRFVAYIDFTSGSSVHHYSSEDDGDCTTPVLCQDCEMVFVEAMEHEFSNEWAADETNHYHACLNDGCEAADGAVAHDYTSGSCVCGITVLTESDVAVEGLEASYVYSDSEQKPAITVTVEGKTLAEGVDYDVEYEDNFYVGTAKVIITFKGVYVGTVEMSFEIIQDPNTGSFEGEWVSF
jgi:hypothetical protein